MSTTHPDHRTTNRESPGLSRSLKTALLMVGLVGGFYRMREHWGHVAGSWIYLLLLACPLMHLLQGHAGHASHGGHGNHGDQPASPDMR